MQLLYASIVAGVARALTSLRGLSATTEYRARGGGSPFLATGLNVRVRTLEVLWVTWAIGVVFMIVRLVLRIRDERRRERLVPAVEGLLRPRIHVPHGIDAILTTEELQAVILHEEQHAR